MDAGKVLEFLLADQGLFEQVLGALVGKKEEVALALSGLLHGRPKLREEIPMIEVLLYALQHGENLFNDPLTGVRDRRLYEAGNYSQLLAEAIRYEHPLSVVMIDVDGFKVINDEFGHEAGDSALKKVASVLLRKARQADVIIRYGGDEFLLLLPHTDSLGASKLMGRVNLALGALNPQLSISYGISTWSPGGDPVGLDGLRREADLLMYDVKSAKKGSPLE